MATLAFLQIDRWRLAIVMAVVIFLQLAAVALVVFVIYAIIRYVYRRR